jgi:hypothetical protein
MHAKNIRTWKVEYNTARAMFHVLLWRRIKEEEVVVKFVLGM